MAKNNVWMSVSDLMTGLMIIFLFIAVAYIRRVQSNQNILNEYVDNKKELHGELIDKFKPEIESGELTIEGDLSMRFEQSETQFRSGEWELTPIFKERLAKIIPKYLDVLLKDTLRDKIKEIRIEGHTDRMPYPNLDDDPYIANIILSQRRALSVLKYIRSLPAYKNYSKKDKDMLEYWFTANGLAYGRTLDSNGQYTFESHRPVNAEKSRRVEIRIVTSGEKVLDNFVEKTR